MTKDQVTEILDRVLTWPAERQADVAHVVEIMEEQDRSMVGLTGEQGSRSSPAACREESKDANARGVQRAATPSLRCMRVIIRESAEADLDHISGWIAKDNPAAAARVVAAIRDRINVLETDELTHMGRPGLVVGTRELSFPIFWPPPNAH
jgi:hypothetical protein